MISKSEEETQKLAKDLAKNLKGGEVIALFGNLGAGKTIFVQGLAQGLGIKRRILSPTFVFMRSYPFTKNGKALTLHHLDLYRGQQTKDFKELGLDEIFSNNSVVVIEWAEKLKDALPKKCTEVFIKVVNEKTRRITITPPPVILRSEATKDLKKAIQVLKNSGVIIFPTDTVYGLGCRFDDQKAIDRIYKIKGTKKTQPFPLLVVSIDQVKELADINPQSEKLIKKYWPGVLTIVLSSHHPEPSSGSKQKIGFRMPGSVLVRNIIEKVGVPIIGTSANFHGQPAPKSYDQLDQKFIKLVDFVIKGKCEGGVESTVVDATVDPPKILRQGAVII